MNYLLDTCALIWLANGEVNKWSKRAIDAFYDLSNEIYVSTVSSWEISIKWSNGKLKWAIKPDEMINKQVEQNRLKIIPIKLIHTYRVADLPYHHRDPFRQMGYSHLVTGE